MSELQNTDLSHRLALAAAEDTPSDVLQQLATDSALEVRQTVAGNPNTSIDTLVKLEAEFPDEIIANPIFNILLLENPGNRFVRLCLARSRFTPPEVLQQLSDIPDGEILRAIAQNVATPLPILEKLVYHTPNFVEEVEGMRPDPHAYTPLFSLVAKNPHTSVELINHLASLYCSNQFELAENPKTPVKFLKKYADYRNLDMHRALLQNPKIPVSVLEILAGEDNKEIRAVVKLHPYASQTAIDTCNFINGQPETPIYILEKLAGDRRSHVRCLVAQNPQTPVSALIKMVRELKPEIFYDVQRDYRWFLINNPNLPAECLEEVAKELFAEYFYSPRASFYDDRAVRSVFSAIARHPHVNAITLDYLRKLYFRKLANGRTLNVENDDNRFIANRRNIDRTTVELKNIHRDAAALSDNREYKRGEPEPERGDLDDIPF
jgi:hypothetical protein